MIISNSCIRYLVKGMTVKKVIILFILPLLTFSFSPQTYSDSPASFSRAKTIAKKLFAHQRETLYCSCRFDEANLVDLSSCNMQQASSIKRAKRIEWEHIMPAEHFGRYFQCWQQAMCEKDGKVYGGRKCCEKIDPVFKHTESELYNLWPSVGVINQVRSNYYYSKIKSKSQLYGCDFSVDKIKKTVEPRNAIKGLVARANLFMSYRYNVPLSKEQRNLFESWHVKYPPTAAEKNWARQVAEIEGYHNPYIESSSIRHE